MRRALEGVVAATAAPLGWLLIQAGRGVSPLADIAAEPVLYGYMTFGTMLVFALFGWHVGRQEDRMRQLSWHDPLTGLYNLRYFRERLDEQMATAAREGEPVSLVYFDIDHFKDVNDHHGHAAGDAVLIALGRHIGRILRHNELFARVGGEEFAVMVPLGGLTHAERLAERILATARALEIALADGDTVSVTLSLGAVEQQEGETLTRFLRRADEAMYAAKEQGRDRMIIDKRPPKVDTQA